MPLEVIVKDKRRAITNKSLRESLLGDGISYSEFNKYKNCIVVDNFTLADYLQYLLDEKTLSCYTKNRTADKNGKVFYPTAKSYITRYSWSNVRVNEEQYFWILHGE